MNQRTMMLMLLLVGAVLLMGQCGGGSDPVDMDGPRVILCLRELGRGTVEQVDAIWTIREAIEAAAETDPEGTPHFLPLFRGQKDERFVVHGGLATYFKKAADDRREIPYCYDIVLNNGRPVIIHEGPLDADAVIGWVRVKTDLPPPTAPPEPVRVVIDPAYIDVDFSAEPDKLLGLRESPELMRGVEEARSVDFRDLAGFEPIPRSEWPQWCEKFPLERLVAAIIPPPTRQTMGSCVGHACMNGSEGPQALLFGKRHFAFMSAMSIYGDRRGEPWGGIGSSPGSGAYIGDAAEVIGRWGILPGDNAENRARFAHVHPIQSDYSASKPSGCAATAAKFRSDVYQVSDEETWFGVTMRDGLRIQIGRSSHSISCFGVIRDGNRYLFLYENSWGPWGSLAPEKSIGADSRAYDGPAYLPCIRDEIVIPVRAQSTTNPTLEAIQGALSL